MASYTPNLNLYKKDPIADGNDFFNIKTMMNDNWDKIDEAVKAALDDIGDLQIEQVRIATGSYVGTGTYGASNPCSLTFPFPPKILHVICVDDGSSITWCGEPRHGEILYFSLNDNTLSWYTNDPDTITQMNVSGWQYYYAASR